MNTIAEERAREERLELAARICNSHLFAKSPRLRDFLLFVTHKYLDNRTAEITEFDIARAVFHRDVGFVPTEDSVVRGAARQLRIKLKEYFEEEGRHEAWRIDIPKGSYVPVFVPSTGSPLPPPSPAPPATPSPGRRALRFSIALNLLFAAACLLLGSAAWHGGPPPPEPSLLSTFLSNARGTVPIIVSDFSQVMMSYMARSRLSLDAYTRHEYHEVAPQPGDAYQQRLFDLLRTHHLTRIGDLNVAINILRIAPRPEQILVRHARDITPRDVRQGSPILLGNPNSTPWTALFEERLGYRWVRGRGYLDLAAGGQEYFAESSTFHERGPGYARLALVPNLDGVGRVLLISGLNMVTMEAAGEFAADPAAWREIRKTLGLRPGSEVPAFEALLQTGSIENTPIHIQLINARLLPQGLPPPSRLQESPLPPHSPGE
jgi:hypothetical protein